MTDQFALLLRYSADGPLVVHELFDHKPELHPDLVVVDVSGTPGIAVGWVQGDDGSFAPFVPALDDARAVKIHQMRHACRGTIMGGFMSSALGTPHRYGSTDSDRDNLGRALRVGLTRPKDATWTAAVSCQDADDAAPVYRPHDVAQLHDLESDLHDMIEKARLRFAGLTRQVEGAATVDIVNAIGW